MLGTKLIPAKVVTKVMRSELLDELSNAMSWSIFFMATKNLNPILGGEATKK